LCPIPASDRFKGFRTTRPEAHPSESRPRLTHTGGFIVNAIPRIARGVVTTLLVACWCAAIAAPAAVAATKAKSTATPAKTSATAAAAPANTNGLAAAAASAESKPFWTGSPNAAEFKQRCELRIARAKEIAEQIRKVQGKRTIENTLRLYDELNNQLDQAASQAQIIENASADSSLRTTAEEMGQEVAAYGTDLSLDRGIYDALKAVDVSKADPETQYYVFKELRDFQLAGVDKDDSTRTKIKAINEQLVKTGQAFNRNIRSDVRKIKVKPDELAGLPQDFIASHKPGADGLVTLDINYPDYVPVMSFCKSDDVRKRLYMEFNNRAYPANMDVLKQMITLRSQLANLCGYPTWADYVTVTKMTGNSKTVRDFIDKIVEVSGPAQQRDYQTLLIRKQKDVPGATSVDMWESTYWAELVRKSDYDFDSQALRPYLPYDRVKQGVLDVTSKMFGVSYRPVKDVPVWDPSVEAYEVLDGGQVIGRFYLDMHPRPNKYNHAAHFPIRTGIAGRQIPEAALICNLPGGTAGDPGLCDINDVTTFFHEFGHLLHNMFAGQHQWSGTGGTRTERDFVEAPSQMLEEWMRDPATVQSFAKHYQTNEPVPTDLMMKMRRSQDFSKGLQVRRQMVYADLSLSIYDRDPSKVDVDAMSKDLVARYQPYKFVDGTHFACSFGHLDGYSAVYYTYMWSLVIAKDMFSAFNQDNLLDPTVAQRYRAAVLAPGGSAPAAKLVENFLGRPYGFDAYAHWLNQAN